LAVYHEKDYEIQTNWSSITVPSSSFLATLLRRRDGLSIAISFLSKNFR
jgi:hypothetical protein